ncbi:MAG TPA: response regulator transcription factor [Candidatus Dormibacteraeota bacterium]
MISPSPAVLVVDGDPATRRVLRTACEGIEAKVLEAATGTEAVQRAIDDGPDLVLLDVGLPDMSGLEVCRRIRAARLTAPIVMVSGHTDLIDVVVGFEMGADDYMRKPYSVRELQARILARLRRMRPAEPRAQGRFELPGLTVDLRRRQVLRDGEEVRLTSIEFDLLSMLLSRRGDTVTRGELHDAVWAGGLDLDSRAIDVHVHRLRRKLGCRRARAQYIETVHGIGYRLARTPAGAGREMART